MHTLKHPLEVQCYTISTYAIEMMVNTIYQWIDILLPGGIIYGDPRVGKTSAIEYIIPEIPRIFKSNIPTFLYLCSDKTITSEGRFYDEMLSMVDHALKSGQTEQKRARFINFLIEAVREQNEYRVLIFIDEAQLLKDAHYNWLLDIHNRLREKKIKLILILVGQRQLIGIKRGMKKSGMRQIISRFMGCTHKFHGLRTIKEFKRFLQGYDENSEFPEGSGITYTQYFIPKAYSNGWRLSDQAELIWKSLDIAMANGGRSKRREWPMQPLATLTYQLLKELKTMDNEEMGPLDPKMVEESIEYSCLADLAGYMNAADVHAAEEVA